jgi:hypothetical protein
MYQAKPFTLSKHILGSGSRVCIDGLDLIGDIPVSVVVIMILQGLDFPVDRYLGMQAPCPFPFVPIV